MSRPPVLEPLGELEAAVMNKVWEHAPASARDVCGRLTGARQRAYTTIMTTMDRLHKKGLLTRRKDGLAWIYTPVMDRAGFERALAERLASTILGTHGDVGLAAFVDAAVDDGVLDRLQRMIDEKRKERRR